MGAALVKKCFLDDCAFVPMPPTNYACYPYRVPQLQQHPASPTQPSNPPSFPPQPQVHTRPQLPTARSAPMLPPVPLVKMDKQFASSARFEPQPRYLVPLHPPLPVSVAAVPMNMARPPQSPPQLSHRTQRRSRQGSNSNDSDKHIKSPTQCQCNFVADTPRSTASTSRCESVLSDDSFYDAESASYSSSVPRTPFASSFSRRPNPNVDFTALLPASYVIDCVLGNGTTATCYRCHRVTDGQQFACKVINKRRLAVDKRQRDELTLQLRREVEIMKQLDHPHIAKLEDTFENETFMILVMELLDGGELFDYIVEQGRLREDIAMQIARDVLSALSYMHAKGIMHRDLKPENLLLTTRKDGTTTVKLIDFGFSRSLGARGTASSFLGTGGYLAPEILLHHRYNASVDMWSFGVVLYLMLSGRLPFASATQLRPGQNITALYRLTFPRKYWEGVSDEGKQLVKSLLLLSPHRRLSASLAAMHPWFGSHVVY